MNIENSTIAAIATPAGVGGIAVIRISGENAFLIADKVFRSVSKTKVSQKSGYTAMFGQILDGKTPLDDVVCTIFKAPKSYTGENVVEFSCHGGIFIAREVLRIIINSGARISTAGEFTKRALLNGKLSLTQAESVSDMISSQNRQSINAAKAQMDGALYKKINICKTELLKIAGAISAYVDYPEDDIPEIETETLKESLTSILENVNKLVRSYDTGKLIRNGIETVIVGKPNVGKSTLMNLLVGEEKSIVTEIAGTTRDVIEETVMLNDIMLKLSDTAGIRDTGDTIEKMGVNLAKKRLERAELVLAVFDGSTQISDDDLQIILAIGQKPCIAIVNKTDLSSKIDFNKLGKCFSHIIEISAKNQSDLDKLEEEIKNILMLNNLDITSGIIVNERQRECIIATQKALIEAKNAVEIGMTLDAVEISVEDAIEFLLELTGERITVEVVNQVFSNFCVGK